MDTALADNPVLADQKLVDQKLAAERQKDVRCARKTSESTAVVYLALRLSGSEKDIQTSTSMLESSRNHVPMVTIPNYLEIKAKNGVYESGKLFTHACKYPYKLLIRPNGLKFTKGYGKCMGIWLKPEPCNLKKPVKVYLSIVVKTQGEASTTNNKLTIPKTECTWDEEDTTSPNPAVCFALNAIQHSDILEADCIDSDGSLTLFVEEIVEPSNSQIPCKKSCLKK